MSKIILALIIIAIIAFMIWKYLKPKTNLDGDKFLTIDDQFNSQRRDREKEIDALLDKIGENGLDYLRQKDKDRLNELAKKIRIKKKYLLLHSN